MEIRCFRRTGQGLRSAPAGRIMIALISVTLKKPRNVLRHCEVHRRAIVKITTGLVKTVVARAGTEQRGGWLRGGRAASAGLDVTPASKSESSTFCRIASTSTTRPPLLPGSLRERTDRADTGRQIIPNRTAGFALPELESYVSFAPTGRAGGSGHGESVCTRYKGLDIYRRRGPICTPRLNPQTTSRNTPPRRPGPTSKRHPLH